LFKVECYFITGCKLFLSSLFVVKVIYYQNYISLFIKIMLTKQDGSDYQNSDIA